VNNLLRASLFHFKAKEAEAYAVLETYCNKSVGVADHSNLVGEINDWVKTLAEAQDSIAVLENLLQQEAQQMSSSTPQSEEG